MIPKNIRVIFDTNVWISFLIGKRLSFIKKYIANGQITIGVTKQLFKKIEEVTNREKLKKYFLQESVLGLLDLSGTIAENAGTIPKHFINRDSKDNFLWGLIDFSNADRR